MGFRRSAWNEERISSIKLLLATLAFIVASGAAVYVTSVTATVTLTEFIYLKKTKCVVSALRVYEEAVPCIVPSCGNIITQSGCRQTGFCLRLSLNFSVQESHTKALGMEGDQISARS